MVKLYFCVTPGEKDERPVGASLHRTPYQAAVKFLEDHPDFKRLESSYMGKQVYEGQDPAKLYSYAHGSVEIDEPTDVVTEQGEVNMLYYRNLSYDDFVSGLPVMTVRNDK